MSNSSSAPASSTTEPEDPGFEVRTVHLGPVNLTKRRREFVALKLFGDGVALAKNWQHTYEGEDGMVSMVFAGWLEERRADLIAVGNDPKELDRLTAALAGRAGDPEHNHTGPHD